MKLWISILLSVFAFSWGFTQDKVILLNGDTVEVFIPGDPRKETNLNNTAIGSLNDYGFKRVIAVYGKDSVRVHFPNQIKEYIRSANGAYLGSGFFFSKMLDEKLLVFRLAGTREVFFQRVNFHKDLIIWYYREDLGHAMPQSYFFAEQKGAPGLIRINTYKEWKKWVLFHPPLDSLSKTVTAPKKRGKRAVGSYFIYLVEVLESYKKVHP